MDSVSPAQKSSTKEQPGLFRSVTVELRTRIISGLLLALPIVLTFWLVFWLYTTFLGIVLTPMGKLTTYLFAEKSNLPFWWEQVVAPILAVVIVMAFLYMLGLMVHSSCLRALDWILRHVPVVTTIYKALTNVAQSLGNQMNSSKSQRVVLVEFPHPGMRALAFVTNVLTDQQSGEKILCVCVLTGVMPPAGFTLYVPESKVTEVDWSVNQAFQAILSGGMTSPNVIPFDPLGQVFNRAGGPLIDSQGKPIDTSSIEHPERP